MANSGTEIFLLFDTQNTTPGVISKISDWCMRLACNGQQEAFVDANTNVSTYQLANS